jgi:hypothetical protein
MSQQSESPKSITSGETLAAYRRVKLSGSTVVYADSGERGIGVNQAVVSTSGDEATIRLDNAGGTSKMMASGAITAGVKVYPDDDGKITATQTDPISIGNALETSTADGDIIEVLATNTADAAADSARSRASTLMPTDAIWNNFDRAGMRLNPLAGSLLETDFTHGEDVPSAKFTDASAVIRVIPGSTGLGELTLFSTADNEEACVQWPSCPITVSGGVSWAFSALVKASQIANTKGGWFIGLMVGDVALAGDHIVDAGTLADVGSLGFQNKEGDGDIIDLVYDKAGQAQNEHDDDYHTLVAGAYVLLEMYFNGTTIQGYLNGVLTGTAISAADIAAADFPAADVLVPTFALKNAAADDVTVTLDMLIAAQLAA